MAWMVLIVAGMCEVVGVLSLKLARGFTRPVPSVSLFVFFGLSLYLLSTAVEMQIQARHIPIGTAYAVFTGIGAGGTGVLGIYLFDEPAGLMRILSLMVIICGVTGLKVSSEPATPTDSRMPLQPRVGGGQPKGGIT